MLRKPRTLTPGPTQLLPEAAAAQLRAGMHHRSPEFAAVLGRVQQGLKEFFRTESPVAILTSSGTGGLEACVAGLVRPGDTVICVNGGKFGKRWADINRAWDANVVELAVEPGRSARLADVEAALKANPQARALFVQGCESSTGAVHPVRAMAELTRGRETLICVDAITWLGAHEVATDEWGLDLVVCASQKALAMPPGLAFVSASEKAHRALTGKRRYYFDLARELDAQAQGQMAFTPATSLVCAAEAALAWVHSVGLDDLVQNARVLAAMTRAAAKALQLPLFSEFPADSVTALKVPDASKVQAFLYEHSGATVAGGQDEWRGKLLRLSHLGYVDYMDTIALIGALEQALTRSGAKHEPGTGLQAAQQVYAQFVA